MNRNVKRRSAVERAKDKAPRSTSDEQRYIFGGSHPERLAKELAAFNQRKCGTTARPRWSADPGGKLPKSGCDIAGKAKEKISASFAKAPAKRATWGHTGRYVEVKAPQAFASANLRFRLDKKETGHLHANTIFVARWDVGAERFFIVPQSGYNARSGYAFARISRPGFYTAIGLPRDPRILTTLRLFSAVRPWTQGKEAGLFVEPICKVMMCPPFMDKLMGDEDRLAGLGRELGDFTGGFGGGNACEQCRSIDPQRLPELDIHDFLDLAHSTLDISIAEFVDRGGPTPWVNVGPNNFPGRITVLAIDPGDGTIVYAGTTAGGVWKTTNAGGNWSPTMLQESSLAIGGLAIAASNPDVLYAATGVWPLHPSAQINHLVYEPIVFGTGVLRTADRGNSWQPCSPIASRFCSAVAVDPTDHQRVFVAGELGLHRTADGGASWDTIFNGEVSDVVIDPDDVDRIYIGVLGDALYRSTDGGGQWTRLAESNGIETGAVVNSAKIALGRNGAHGSRFVAVKMRNRVYTSRNGGDSFQRQHDVDVNLLGETFRSNVVAVHPGNESKLYAGYRSLSRSVDGGQEFEVVYNRQDYWFDGEVRSIVFDPGDQRRLFLATDEGVWRSTDEGATWHFASPGLVATQIYRFDISQTPALRMGAAIRLKGGAQFVSEADWQSFDLGDGGHVQYDPANEQIIYHDAFNSHLLKKSTDGGASWQNIAGINSDAVDVLFDIWSPYRKSLAIARADSQRLLVLRWTDTRVSNRGARTVARSTNGGADWEDVLPSDVYSTVQFAPSDDNLAYVGSRDGRVWLSWNGGQTWIELTAISSAPFSGIIQSIAVDWHDPLRFYVALSDAGSGNRHLFRGQFEMPGAAHPAGVTWTDVSGPVPSASGTLPETAILGLALHPWFDDVIYVSTAFGVLQSSDGGDSWTTFNEGLPQVFVSNLEMRLADRMLYASTMGRGLYRIMI